MDVRSKPFLVSFNHFFFVSALALGRGLDSFWGEGGPDPAKMHKAKKSFKIQLLQIT